MTVLVDLWCGNINPHEEILTQNKRYKHLLSLMGRNRDELSDTDQKQAETMEKYDDAVSEMKSVADVEAFSYGCRFGIRLMFEANNLCAFMKDRL